jgi:hypothetical protein
VALRPHVPHPWLRRSCIMFINKEFRNLYSSPDIIRQFKSRRIDGRGMWHAWERRDKCTRFWWETPKERDHSEGREVDGRMESEQILGDWLGGCGLDSTGSG